MKVAPRLQARFFTAMATSALAVFAAPAIAAPDGRCSHDTLTIEGNPVVVTLCATKADAKTVDVAETFAGKNATFTHATTIDLFPNEDAAHGIDDVPLAPLGLTETVHLAMHYKAGTIELRHALLRPGAVILK